MKTLGTMLLLVGVAGMAAGFPCGDGCAVPEISLSAGGNALALLSGALLIFRGRRAK